jgi:predicted nuclease of restriction endonuclease-like (RecB) superfamily
LKYLRNKRTNDKPQKITQEAAIIVKNVNVSADKISFNQLVNSIQQTHNELSAQANKAVNVSLTLRNWLIGFYIFEYELNGSDRADYGKKILESLSEHLCSMSIPRTDVRELRRYRQFYESYPQIGESLTPQLQNTLDLNTIGKRESLTPVCGELLISSLSFTHISSLLQIDDHTKRAFYEIESIRGNWSVRELKRQINSLYFERSGLSIDKEKLSAIANQSAEKSATQLLIRDPYVFEFLGLKPREVMSESHLEDELLKNIEDFLLELGHGFCFEGGRNGY